MEEEKERIVQDRVRKVLNNEMTIDDLFESVGNELAIICGRDWNKYGQYYIKHGLVIVEEIVGRIKDRLQHLENKQTFLLEQNDMSNLEQYRSQYNALYGPLGPEKPPGDAVPPSDGAIWVGSNKQGRNLFLPRYNDGLSENERINAGDDYLKFKTKNMRLKPNRSYTFERDADPDIDYGKLGRVTVLRRDRNHPGWINKEYVPIQASPYMDKLIGIVGSNQLAPKYYPDTVTLSGAGAYAGKRAGWKAHEGDITGADGRPDGVNEVYITDNNGNIRILNGWGLKDSDYGLRKAYRNKYATPEARREVPFALFKKRYNTIAPKPDKRGNFVYEMEAGKGWKHFRPYNITPRKYFAQFVLKPAYKFFYEWCQFHPTNPWAGQLKALSYNVALSQAFYGFLIPTFVDAKYDHNKKSIKERNNWMKENKLKLMGVLYKFVQDKAYMQEAFFYILSILHEYWQVQRQAGKVLNEDKIFNPNQIDKKHKDAIFKGVYQEVLAMIDDQDNEDKKARLEAFVPDVPGQLLSDLQYQDRFKDMEEFKDYYVVEKERPEFYARKAYEAAAAAHRLKREMLNNYKNPFIEGAPQVAPQAPPQVVQQVASMITDEELALNPSQYTKSLIDKADIILDKYGTEEGAGITSEDNNRARIISSRYLEYLTNGGQPIAEHFEKAMGDVIMQKMHPETSAASPRRTRKTTYTHPMKTRAQEKRSQEQIEQDVFEEVVNDQYTGSVATSPMVSQMVSDASDDSTYEDI